MKTTVSLILASSAILASAQYSINPNNVPNATRQEWCTNQMTQCPLICLQTPGNTAVPEANTCDYQLLTYSCVCSNGISPNISEYSQTLPYYICTEWGTECVHNCGSDSNCAASCRQNHPCGAQNPTRVNTSTISSTATPSSKATIGGAQTTGSQTGTSIIPIGQASQTGTSAAVAAFRPIVIEFGRAWGLAVIVAGLFGGFAIFL